MVVIMKKAGPWICNHFVKSSLKKLVLACIFVLKNVIKYFLDYCEYSRVCNNGKKVGIELLRTVLNVIFTYFQLKYG